MDIDCPLINFFLLALISTSKFYPHFFRKTAVLHWFQDQRLIDPGAGREKGVITQVDLGSDLQVFLVLLGFRFFLNFVGVVPHSVAQGWLTVAKTSIHHSGNYSCVASYSRPAWLLVHIVAGDLSLNYAQTS